MITYCCTISRVSRARVLSALCLALLFLTVETAVPQSSSKTTLTYKLLSLRVKGLTHLKEDQITRASGLKIGQSVGEEDFKQALANLGDTGLFTNLTYSYHYSKAGCDLDIQVSENDKLLPISFDNFVWFSDDQLLDLLRARVPLFEDRLPEAGNLADQVTDALNAVLAEKNISGKADYLRSASKLNGPIDSYVYRVTFHAIVVHNVDYPGAGPGETPALEAANQLTGQDYLRSKVAPQVKVNFLPVYLSRGYLKAKLGDPVVKVASDGPQTLVDLSIPVTPGIQYKLTQMAWTGNAAFPSNQLRGLVQLKEGEPANVVELDKDIEALQTLYGTKGYLMAQIKPVPSMDDSQAAVAYQFNVTEGDQFRMGDLLMDGIDDATAKRITAQWEMKKGDVYDRSYPKRFFDLIYRDISLHRSYSVVPKETINQQDKTVSVAMHFSPKK